MLHSHLPAAGERREWSGGGMKIIVAIKQVPERDAQLSVSSDGRWIDDDGLNYVINEPDAYALEEALQFKVQHGGEVIALCAGPERVTSTLRETLAKGADRAIHIASDTLGALDTLSLAHVLAETVRAESPDLVLTGLQSDDLGLGQTGVVLAELLGLPHSTLVLHVEKTGTGIRVKRELEDGWFQHIDLPLPAVLTIQSGGNKLRYATLMGIKKAKTKETRTIEAAAPDRPSAVELTRVFLPEKQKQTQMLKGTPAEIASQLVEKLRSEVRVL
jgi:electron transfer flavoprotein beta subunit